MKKNLICLAAMFVLCFGSTIFGAEAPSQPSMTVRGSMSIDYNTRTQKDESGNPKAGVQNFYWVDLTVLDTVVFRGQIIEKPTLFSAYLGRETQQGGIEYKLGVKFCNPANLTQVRDVGKLVGVVPIDKKGAYQFDSGNLRIGMEAIGTAAAFEAPFKGIVVGKPPKNDSTLAKTTNKARTIYRSVGGKTVKIEVTKYDMMEFNNLRLPAGPAKVYVETTVNGKMLYDYDRSVWFFDGVTMTYQMPDGKMQTDKLSGNIRWTEDANRKTNGLGAYEFDVRVNEPEAANTEAAAFQKADDESSYFAVDPKVTSLTGTAKYTDTMVGDSPSASKVVIDLKGNGLTRAQVMNLVKTILLVSVAPMNAE